MIGISILISKTRNQLGSHRFVHGNLVFVDIFYSVHTVGVIGDYLVREMALCVIYCMLVHMVVGENYHRVKLGGKLRHF